MKKLVIHIGWPKTASTSLQVSVLCELHKKGLVNYIGRRPKSPLYDADSEPINKLGQLLVEVRRRPFSEPFLAYQHSPQALISEADLSYFQGILSNDLQNILSHEDLTTPYWYLHTLSIPTQLYKLFGNTETEIQIVATIRSQAALMYSLYVQRYSQYKNYNFTATPSLLHFDLSSKDRPRLFDSEYTTLFNFYSILLEYERIFGSKNIRVLLFEDLFHNKEAYLDQIAEVVGIDDVSFLRKAYSSENSSNVSQKKGQSYVRTEDPKSILLARRLVRRIYPSSSLFRKVAPRASKSLSSVKQVVREAYLSHVRTTKSIPDFSELEKSAIFDYYKDSNVNLAKRYKLDEKAMKKYGYF